MTYKSRNGNTQKYYLKADSDGDWIVWESPFKIEMFQVTEKEKLSIQTLPSKKRFWAKVKLFNKKRQGK